MIAMSPNGKFVSFRADQLPMVEPGENTSGLRLFPNFRIQSLVTATPKLQVITNLRNLSFEVPEVQTKPTTAVSLRRGEKAHSLLQLKH